MTNRKTFPIIVPMVNADFYAGHNSYIIGLVSIFSVQKTSFFKNYFEREKYKILEK